MASHRVADDALGIESHAVWPLVLWAIHIRWSTFSLALGAVVF